MTEFYSNFSSTSNKQSPQNAICIANSLLNFANRHVVCVNECTEANIISLLSFLHFLYFKVCFGFCVLAFIFFVSFIMRWRQAHLMRCNNGRQATNCEIFSISIFKFNLNSFYCSTVYALELLIKSADLVFVLLEIYNYFTLQIIYLFLFFHKLQHSFNLCVFVSLLIRYWIINNLRS